MFKSPGMRSSALARAQAQLSGQRIPMAPKDTNDELQEYMNALNKKASVLKHKKPSAPGLSDLSDLSTESSESPKKTKDNEAVKPLKDSVGQSRFLKKKQNVEEPALPSQARPNIQNDNKPRPSSNPVRPSTTRSSAALRKLAELENKIRSRKLEAEPSDVDSDLRTSDERPFSARSGSDLSGRGNRFLKKTDVDQRLPGAEIQGHKKVNVGPPNQRRTAAKSEVVLESEEEEIKRLIGSSVEFSDENDNWWKRPNSTPRQMFGAKVKRTPSPPTKGSPRRSLHRTASFHSQGSVHRGPSRLSSRTPSPPSKGTPRHTRRTRSLSRSPMSSVRSSLNSNSTPRFKLMSRSRTPISGRSDIKSLDELFSRASVIDSVASESSTDFKVNILSLDDLAPNIQLDTPRELEKTQKKEKKLSTRAQKNKNIQSLEDTDIQLPTEDFVRFGKEATQDSDSASEIATETDNDMEISEHLNIDSTPRTRIRFSGPGDTSSLQGESTARTAYSDDFEKSTHTAVTKDTDSEKTMSHPPSYSASSGTDSSSLTSKLPVHTSPLHPKKRRGEGKTKGAVKEVSVQTSDPAFIYHWSNLAGSAVLGPALGQAYIDPVPIANHVVSPDAVEAMTAYSPAVFALNDMLKQQLLLTQQFVEMSRHLHLASLESLKSESYHYITLEETKEYIKKHRPPSLTPEQALEDVRQEMRAGQ
ncbi:uncharacterized protein C19orf44 homolog isoform X2 [Lissotriton helveticus]